MGVVMSRRLSAFQRLCRNLYKDRLKAALPHEISYIRDRLEALLHERLPGGPILNLPEATFVVNGKPINVGKATITLKDKPAWVELGSSSPAGVLLRNLEDLWRGPTYVYRDTYWAGRVKPSVPKPIPGVTASFNLKPADQAGIFEFFNDVLKRRNRR